MKLNFIIVDDDAINNMMCKMAIARHFGPVTIDCFQSPKAALENIAKKTDTANVLFLDLNIPEMNGWEFLAEFSKFDASISGQFTIYILSASTNDLDRELAEKNRHVTGFVSKPLTAKKLEKVFKTLPESYGIKCFE